MGSVIGVGDQAADRGRSGVKLRVQLAAPMCTWGNPTLLCLSWVI